MELPVPLASLADTEASQAASLERLEGVAQSSPSVLAKVVLSTFNASAANEVAHLRRLSAHQLARMHEPALEHGAQPRNTPGLRHIPVASNEKRCLHYRGGA